MENQSRTAFLFNNINYINIISIIHKHWNDICQLLHMMQINQQIEELMLKSQELIDLSIVGCELAKDESCLLLFAVVQDCAYKILRHAKEELAFHKNGGSTV